MKRILLIAAVLTLVLDVTGCGSVNPPTSLTAEGSLCQIRLNWSAVENAEGYNVYRKTDTTPFVKITTTPVTGTSYTDAIASPDGDGVFYSYQVKAVTGNGRESDASNTARTMHGTRLTGTLTGDASTDPEYQPYNLALSASPYVVDPGVALKIEGQLQIGDGVSLYVLEGSTISVQWKDSVGFGRMILVQDGGLLKVLGTAGSPVTLTAYAEDGTLDPGNGMGIRFEEARAECEIRYARIEHLRQFDVYMCDPTIEECYLNGEGAYFSNYSGSPTIRHCRLDEGLTLFLFGAPVNSAKDFVFEYNAVNASNLLIAFMDGYYLTGCVTNNIFSATTIKLSNQRGTTNIPLMNNYWTGGKPTVTKDATMTVVDINFDPMLTSAPAGAGPSW